MNSVQILMKPIQKKSQKLLWVLLLKAIKSWSIFCYCPLLKKKKKPTESYLISCNKCKNKSKYYRWDMCCQWTQIELKGTPLLSELKFTYRQMHHLLSLKRVVKATFYSTTWVMPGNAFGLTTTNSTRTDEHWPLLGQTVSLQTAPIQVTPGKSALDFCFAKKSLFPTWE